MAANCTSMDIRSTSEGHVEFFVCIQPCSRAGGGKPRQLTQWTTAVRCQQVEQLSGYGINSNHHKSDFTAVSNRFPDFLVIRPSKLRSTRLSDNNENEASHSCAQPMALASAELGLKKKKRVGSTSTEDMPIAQKYG